MTRRRIFALLALVVVGPLLLLGVEVQLARSSGGRLDDEVGERPRQREVRPGDAPLHVVWLGDSTSTGVGAAAFTDSMAWRVAEGLTDGPVVLTVLGRSGDQVHEVLDEQLPELPGVLLPGADHVVLVSIGANDVTALTRRPTFEARYLQMVDRIDGVLDDASVDGRLVLVGIPDIGTAPRLLSPLRQVAGLRGAQLDDEIAGVARRRGVHHVELADRTSRTFSSDPDRYFSADGYHPSSDGHEVWADAVLASLEP
ncbi:GDSL-type esterase/lipase family protein [Acidimicrobiia bacterium EGI L10123]|uniref:GDSL-type esterase/lipase family protein n=1 Tax=Salinilacustrithrix flava TaxID=2957203 RepID=UPI003D7C154B|nr:GDSL-type esterase/lipase family protein [Acidimicrobiia bacterium EGI L10123]